MLEKPPIADEKIVTCLSKAYGLHVRSLDFLAWGADINTAVYRAIDADESAYFVKMRRDNFDEMSLIVPSYLHEQGIMHISAPLKATSGALWVTLEDYHLSVSPFIAGHNGFETHLTDAQWNTLGATLKRLHTAPVPNGLQSQLQCETFNDHFRQKVAHFQQMVANTDFHEPISAALADLLRTQRQTISYMIGRASHLAMQLQENTPDYVLCHADIHAGNVLIDDEGQLYVVDWDTVMLAPKERDLMFIGGGIGSEWRGKRGIEQFYEGYGPTEINSMALAYYRYERIVEDIAAYCEEIWLSGQSDTDRAEGMRQLSDQFEPGNVVDIARKTDNLLPSQHRRL